MKNIFRFILISISVLIISCGSSEILIPEGTDPVVAEIMKKHRLNLDNATKLVDAFDSNSTFKQNSLNDISSVVQKTIRGRRVLEVNISGRNKMYINLD